MHGSIQITKATLAWPRAWPVVQSQLLGHFRMHILAQLPADFWFTVIFMFGGVFVFVLISLADAKAQGGWSSFAKRYHAQTRPDAKAYRVPSWRYCNVNCNAIGLRVILTDTGIYLYKVFPSSFAHPPFLLPWKSVKRIQKGYGFFGEYSILEIEDSAGKLRLNLSNKIEHELARYQNSA